MAVYEGLIHDGQTPVIYVIGSRMLEDRLREFAKEVDELVSGQATVAYIDAAGADGAQLSETYDVEEALLPAVLLLEDDDSVYQDWYGADLPPADQIAYAVSQLTGSSD